MASSKNNRRRKTKGSTINDLKNKKNGKRHNRTDSNLSTQERKNRNGKDRKRQGKKNRFKDKHPKLLMFIKIMIILILLFTIIGTGIIVGYVFGFFGDDFTIEEKELKIAASNSVVVNSDGTKVLADLSGDEKRKIVSINEMSAYLPKAYVAIEDERFYKHHGVDFKRTGGAILTYVTKKGSSYGGSTITQQLVKNITKEADRSIFRKVKEWAKAYQVEKILSKDEILELYLNILFVGGTNYGVELGAEYYFNTTAKDLSLAQCAFLAGINNSPNKYDPYSTKEDHTELIKKRVLTVLSKMKELGYIENEDEYNKAVAEAEAGLKFEKKQTTGNLYSYHTDALLDQVVKQVAEEKEISKQLAENYVYSSGLKIYSTQDDTVQAAIDEEFAKTEKYCIKSRKSKNEDGSAATSQAAMAIIDHTTGYVLGVAGGLGDKIDSRGLNRATQSTRQTGSSMKPIADLVPGLEEGIITAATEYNDAETEFPGNYKPKNYNYFRGVVTVRDAIETSQNIPFVKIMAELTTDKAFEYLKKMGITTLDETKDKGLSLAIGGITNGISPLEMAGAYATIANDGVYIEPTFYTKVVDANGETVLTPNQRTERVMSVENAYIAKNILTAPVVGAKGTAKYCAIPGIETAAKTGTTNSDFDRWLCGFTPYYTAATWYGFDINEEVNYSGTNPAGQLWSNVMKAIHKPLANSDFIRPEGIVEATICTSSGGLASAGCTNKRTEVFVKGTVPTACEGHSGSYEICTESGLLANEYCPNTERKTYGGSLPKEQLNLWNTKGGSGKSGAPKDYCNIHNKPEETKPEKTTPSQSNSKPKITLNGKPSMTLTVGETFTDPGATAKDDKDGDITSKITTKGSVDTTKAGSYTISYTVSNSSGVTTTVKRTVTVKEKSSEGSETPETPETPEQGD
ncbi:MAG: transglycosylase domain-containing protein [Clostridia bacterium]|nr:transglycosylase domain-containing protein [Clostridia bacterium]